MYFYGGLSLTAPFIESLLQLLPFNTEPFSIFLP